MSHETSTLIAALQCCRVPVTAKQIGEFILAAKGEVWNERKIRKVASSLQERVISGPGMSGYLLTEHATREQKQEAINRLNSQAKRMQERALQIALA